MKDWLGQEISIGDWILYAKSYGCNHGCQMVLAEIVKVNASTVVASIIKQSRSGGRRPMMLTDVRTGKEVRGYGNSLHVKKPAHYAHKETGEELSYQQMYSYNDPRRKDYKYVPDQYWDYVQPRPATTTFQITDNILKVNKEDYANLAGNKETAQS